MFYRKSPAEIEAEKNKTLTEDDVRYGPNPTCYEVHKKWDLECDENDCRNWINYCDDLNCAVVCARKNPGGLSLREVANRMGVSFPRISQIEHATFRKLTDIGMIKDLDDE